MAKKIAANPQFYNNEISIKNEDDKDTFRQKPEFTKESLIKENSKEKYFQEERNSDEKI